MSDTAPGIGLGWRVLIDQGAFGMTNLGDVAMAQVAVRRVRARWPGVWIGVVTDREDLLTRFYPGTHPIPAHGRRIWFREASIFTGGPIIRSLPRWVSTPAGRIESAVRNRWPSLGYRGLRSLNRLRGRENRGVGAFLDALWSADLLLMSGAGDITSVFENISSSPRSRLELLRLARTWGVSTVMLGQGLGPIHSPRLWNQAKRVLPQVDLIGLREKRKGLWLLQEMGVPPGRVCVTGDDAVELAFSARPASLGTGIGINLRRASYSDVDDRIMDLVAWVLREASRRQEAPLVPVPVSIGGTDSDVPTIRRLLMGHGVTDCDWEAIDSPEGLIQQISRCRLVVSGSYHAAVFALAQGIPAVGLAKSEYYVDKFLGLTDMFGEGCECVNLNDPAFPDLLARAIDRAWGGAEEVRPKLLTSAAAQVEAGQAAYRRCFKIVERRRYLREQAEVKRTHV